MWVLAAAVGCLLSSFFGSGSAGADLHVHPRPPYPAPYPRWQGAHNTDGPPSAEDLAASDKEKAKEKEKEKERALALLGKEKAKDASKRPPDRPLMREDMYNL